jgi:hypothetical protein
VRDRLTELGETTDVALITFSDPEKLAAYSARNPLPFPILIDRDRAAYRAFGLGRGSFLRVWGWQAGRRYLEILRADGLSGLRRPEEDTLQLGGDFVVGPDGALEYGFWGEGPDDRPSVDDLIAQVRRISG